MIPRRLRKAVAEFAGAALPPSDDDPEPVASFGSRTNVNVTVELSFGPCRD